jgi:hypothetical protein
MDQTDQDRSNEYEVSGFIFEQIISRFPFVGHKMKWTPQDQGDGTFLVHDSNIWYSGYRVGIIEVKCREYDAAFFEQRGYMIDHDKMEYLWKQNRLGFKAMLAVRSSDRYVFTAMIEDLVAGKGRWGTPTPEMMGTTNHGKDQRKESKEGHILPMDLFYNIGQMERTDG